VARSGNGQPVVGDRERGEQVGQLGAGDRAPLGWPDDRDHLTVSVACNGVVDVDVRPHTHEGTTIV